MAHVAKAGSREVVLKFEIVVLRRGGKAGCWARVSTHYAELLIEGGNSRLEREVVDILG